MAGGVGVSLINFSLAHINVRVKGIVRGITVFYGFYPGVYLRRESWKLLERVGKRKRGTWFCGRTGIQ